MVPGISLWNGRIHLWFSSIFLLFSHRGAISFSFLPSSFIFLPLRPSIFDFSNSVGFVLFVLAFAKLGKVFLRVHSDYAFLAKSFWLLQFLVVTEWIMMTLLTVFPSWPHKYTAYPLKKLWTDKQCFPDLVSIFYLNSDLSFVSTMSTTFIMLFELKNLLGLWHFGRDEKKIKEFTVSLDELVP